MLVLDRLFKVIRPCRRRMRTKSKILVFMGLAIGILILVGTFLIEHSRENLTREIKFALGSRNTSAQVKMGRNTTLINSGLCRPSGGMDSLLAAIVVMSTPNQYEDRKRIRSQWHLWNGYSKSVQLLFFVGLPKDRHFKRVVNESRTFKDIILENMEESYYSLTLKTLRMLKWFTFSCSKVKYLIKADMDTFIHLPNLVKYLNWVEDQGSQFSEGLVGGAFVIDPMPISDPTSKWYMPADLLQDIHLIAGKGSPFPNYLDGSFYVISSALVPKILERSLAVPLIQFEDVFLTGVVANKGLRLELTRIPNVHRTYLRFHAGLFPSYYNDSIIACHLQGRTELLNKYSTYYQSLLNERLNR